MEAVRRVMAGTHVDVNDEEENEKERKPDEEERRDSDAVETVEISTPSIDAIVEKNDGEVADSSTASSVATQLVVAAAAAFAASAATDAGKPASIVSSSTEEKGRKEEPDSTTEVEPPKQIKSGSVILDETNRSPKKTRDTDDVVCIEATQDDTGAAGMSQVTGSDAGVVSETGQNHNEGKDEMTLVVGKRKKKNRKDVDGGGDGRSSTRPAMDKWEEQSQVCTT